jgi:hypothetical protein
MSGVLSATNNDVSTEDNLQDNNLAAEAMLMGAHDIIGLGELKPSPFTKGRDSKKTRQFLTLGGGSRCSS